MKNVGLLIMLSLCTCVAQADLFETRNDDGSLTFSDRATSHVNATRHDRAISNPLEADDLPGVWLAKSDNGQQSKLTLRKDGSFVFDQSNVATAHRVYMCGTWNSLEKSLALDVQAFKRRLANGETEQASTAFLSQANIMSARRDRIILQIEGQELVFDRSS